jgi:hypothetical protein
VATQNDRATRDPLGPDLSSKAQPGMALSNKMHPASPVGQLPDWQLSCVQ